MGRQLGGFVSHRDRLARIVALLRHIASVSGKTPHCRAVLEVGNGLVQVIGLGIAEQRQAVSKDVVVANAV